MNDDMLDTHAPTKQVNATRRRTAITAQPYNGNDSTMTAWTAQVMGIQHPGQQQYQ